MMIKKSAVSSVVSSVTILETTGSSVQTELIDRIQSTDPALSARLGRTISVDQETVTLQLPSDFPKTPATTYQPDCQSFSLPDQLTELLNTRSSLEGVDVRSLLLTAFKTLLYRYTQQETIQLSVIVPNPSIDPDDIAEISTQMYGELSTRALVNYIAEALDLNAQENLQKTRHQSQLEDQSDRHLNSSIIATFLENLSKIEDATQWLAAFRQQNTQLTNSVDLHFVLLQQAQGISGVLEYNANLFEAPTIARLLGHFQTLLKGIADHLDGTIAQLPMLTQAEEHQMLVEWKGASVDYPRIAIYQHIEAHAIQNPDAIAVRFKDEHLTYAALNQRANQLAHYLKSVGVEAEDRVAVCVQPSLEIAVSLLGIFKAGGVYVPLDPTHPENRLTSILEDTQAKVLLTQSSLLPNLPAIVSPSLCLDTDWETIHPFSIDNLEIEINLDQTAYIIYTSGTTGKPKGVMATHRNLVNYILATQEQLGFNDQDVMPSVARFTFSIALFELLSPLAIGGTLVLLERDHILDFKRLTQTLDQLTMLHTVPSLMQKLLTYIIENGLDLQRFQGIKHIFTGGDIVAPDLLEMMKTVFQNANIAVLYGCSEVSSLCSTYPVPRDQRVTKSRVGKPFKNVSLRLYDANQNLVPLGIPGEIYIGGAGVTRGYLNREDLTQEKFVTIDGQRFYRTGDLGRLCAQGNLEFLGRTDFQIKLRGMRIELGDIEATLRQAPGVREGVVMARELGKNDEKSLVAYLVLEPLQNASIEAIRRFAQTRLPNYMVPAAFVVLEAMPLNPNQKVDRRALPLPTLENLAGFKPIVPPRNEWEQQLTTIWENVLGIQPIGIQNNFFDLGGNSLLAVQMLAQVEQQWGKNLPITTLLQAPTVEDLIKVLRSTETEDVIGDLVLLRSGSKPPLFCIYGILLYQDLVTYLDPDQPVCGVFLQEEIELVKTGKFDPQNSVFTSVPSIADRYLQAIRAFQPQGPYYLAGESFGGVVAFEIAQQLRAAGEEVALVALFDSWMLNSYVRMPLTRRLKLHLKLLSKHGLSYYTKTSRQRTASIRRRLSTHMYKVYQQLHPLIKNMGQTVAEAAQQDVRSQVQQSASQSYAPVPYDGKIVLFRAMERDAFEVDRGRDLGWKLLAAGDFHIFDVPGDHLGILKDPNVQVLAEQLQLHLQQ